MAGQISPLPPERATSGVAVSVVFWRTPRVAAIAVEIYEPLCLTASDEGAGRDKVIFFRHDV